MSDWPSWTLYEWSEALLEHYFGVGSSGEPVEALVVTGAELATAAGDPDADTGTVEHSLVRMVIRGVGEKSFWLHAQEKAGMRQPYYLAHLAVACLAATDVEALDERGYIDRLKALTQPTNGDLHIEIMADLWQHLAGWLVERPDQYRRLVLPDPGGWTRIGYTVRLAFPTRRDLRSLTRCLAERDLLVPDPPVGLVLAAVGSRGTADFTERFRSELGIFRQQRREGARGSELRLSPFWLAVRAATGATVSDRTAAVISFAIVASDDGYDLELMFVAQGDVARAGLATEELDDAIGQWTHTGVVDGRRDVALEMLLDGRLSPPGLSQLVRGGVIPLVEGLHGQLESTSHRELLADADAALVRSDVVTAVVENFGTRSSRARACSVEGWTFVDHVSLHTSTSEALRGTPLEGSWILHEAPTPRVIRVVGGVHVGSAWLGAPSLLPAVDVAGARSVNARLGPDSISLERLSDSRWALPRSTLDGTIEFVAELEDYALRKTVQFVAAPSTEAFRYPGSTTSWVYEDQARARAFRERVEADAQEMVTISHVEPTVYLGRDIGVFAEDGESAAWEVIAAAGNRRVYPLLPVADLWPQGQVEEAGARRAWRKLLTPRNTRSSSLDVDSLRAQVVSRPARTECLPTVPGQGDSRPLEIPGEEPDRRIDDAVLAVAALANNRAGIDRRWLVELLTDVAALEAPVTRQVIRAWQEAELLDELVNVTWSGRRFVAVGPRLRIFRDNHGVRASLVGLVLPTTLAEVASVASSADIDVTPTVTLSPFVPQSVTLRAVESAPIEELAARLRIVTSLVGADPFRVHPGRDLGPASDAPSVGYEDEQVMAFADNCVMKRRWRSRAPTLWTVECGQFSTWTHFFEAARLWAAAFIGLDVSLEGPLRFNLANCYLPLAAARWLSSTGGVRSGPVDAASTGYVYGAPTRELRDDFVVRFKAFLTDNLDQMRRLGGGLHDV
jgi:hypothetical protein